MAELTFEDCGQALELRDALPCIALFKEDEMCYGYNGFVARLFERK
jgi:hypothetical protein